MYVEDESDKTIRLAKRKAYGPCNLHQDHFNWGNFFLGGFIVMWLAVGLATATWPDKPTHIAITYSCTTNDPKTGNITGYSGYLNSGSTFSVDANSSCVFTD